MDETTKIILTKPIQAHGQTVSALELRSPTAREFIEAGRPPYTVAGDGGVAPDLQICAKLLAKICAIPPSSVEQLVPADLFKAVWVVVGFTGGSPDGEAPAGAPPTASNS